VPGQLYPLIPGRLSFVAHEDDEHTAAEISRNPELFFFSTDLHERYRPFCSDFGPVNLAAVARFCEYMRDKEADARLAGRHLVYYCSDDVESVSNAAFLLGAHLLLQHAHTPDAAARPFTTIHGIPIVPFRDATFVKSSFPLTVLDCLRGLRRAVEMGWFRLGEFDVDAYEALDDADVDMHRVCPKFIACRGPDQHAADTPPVDETMARLRGLGASAVVRLNEASSYGREASERAGLRHYELFFEDCKTPSDALVAKFLSVARNHSVVGVHCQAGLGRTGTMIGVWLVGACGFTAAEAIAWLRIVRPGSVIGPQQNYLQWIEARLRFGPAGLGAAPQATASPGATASAGPGAGVLGRSASAGFAAVPSALSEQLAAQIRSAVSRRR